MATCHHCYQGIKTPARRHRAQLGIPRHVQSGAPGWLAVDYGQPDAGEGCAEVFDSCFSWISCGLRLVCNENGTI